uniref:Uncharacterized protein n=1 Tax=Mus spicilegus TaxID=10103 RepID=A0A8C6ILI3_MUSSI
MKRQMPTCGVCVTEANHELCRTDDEAPFCHNMSPWSQELTACSAGHGAWHGGGQERRKNIQVGGKVWTRECSRRVWEERGDQPGWWGGWKDWLRPGSPDRARGGRALVGKFYVAIVCSGTLEMVLVFGLIFHKLCKNFQFEGY